MVSFGWRGVHAARAGAAGERTPPDLPPTPRPLLTCHVCVRRDVAFGYGNWSNAASVMVGLLIMVGFRALNVPLAEGFPSGEPPGPP